MPLGGGAGSLQWVLGALALAHEGRTADKLGGVFSLLRMGMDDTVQSGERSGGR